jgi:hypothetical protein
MVDHYPFPYSSAILLPTTIFFSTQPFQKDLGAEAVTKGNIHRLISLPLVILHSPSLSPF